LSSLANCANSRRAEDVLWRCLCGSRFDGAKFRRQVPFDRYVVDFYCHAAKLVIELDGKQHEWFSDYGAGRTEVLQRLGVGARCPVHER
jgi:very-short-patch-repair endonuclease